MHRLAVLDNRTNDAMYMTHSTHTPMYMHTHAHTHLQEVVHTTVGIILL